MTETIKASPAARKPDWLKRRLPSGEALMAIDVEYDRTTLAVNDVIEVAVRVELKEGAARQAFEKGLGAFDEARAYAAAHPSDRQRAAELYKAAAREFVSAWRAGAWGTSSSRWPGFRQ